MSVIKEKILLVTEALLVRVYRSSRGTRIRALGPVVLAAMLAAMAVATRIFLLGHPPGSALADFFRIFVLMVLFLCPLAWVSLRLLPGVAERFHERRALDALTIGLYLPHLFITLFILYTQFTGSEIIFRVSGAIATWAMFSLLLTPVSLVFVFLIWTFLPRPKDAPATATAVSPREDGKPVINRPVVEQDSKPLQRRLSRRTGFRRNSS